MGRICRVVLVLCIVAGAFAVPAASRAATGLEGVPRYDHVFTIVLENQNYDTTWNTPAPGGGPTYIQSLRGQGAFASQYFAIGAPVAAYRMRKQLRPAVGHSGSVPDRNVTVTARGRYGGATSAPTTVASANTVTSYPSTTREQRYTPITACRPDDRPGAGTPSAATDRPTAVVGWARARAPGGSGRTGIPAPPRHG